MRSRVPFFALAFSAVALVGALVVPRPGVAAAPAAPAGNAATGAKLFLQCRACHTVNPGGANGVGPNLAGVMGAKAASKPGYTYSPALKNAALRWDAATMDAWLTRPAKVAPGNKMAFAGMANPQARADVIAYLGTLKAK
ncbi:c-type cytochrome [Sphingomonas pokkalii]|uniref:Cytochrome c family protein n=1 Tax=Sphingomonas pokkalii TaxID=2175090 RepID=A0A2U0SJS6_9SPHN|nr:c-type cytochrome [Sphingomonas pokkalii]PVX31583.1 cytochrome c family protein [Sphingomonas pokkalii]